MKAISLLLVTVTLAGCNSAHMQRTIGYGPYNLCHEGHVCFQAGESWRFHQFSEGDSKRFYFEGVECWKEHNRANWDRCDNL